MNWRALPGGAGTVLAVAGAVTAAAEAGRLRVWSGPTGPVLAEFPDPNPARPAVLDGVVRCGPYEVGPDGAVTPLPWAAVPPGYRQSAYAWAPDGRRAVVAGRRIDPAGADPQVAAWLAAPGGLALLWTGSGGPPAAVGFAADVAVVGSTRPGRFAPDGSALDPLDGITPAVRLDAAGDLLLVVESGRLSLWRGSEPVAHRTGYWLDGCLVPDGSAVLAVPGDGTLTLLAVADGLPGRSVLAAGEPITGVATDGRVVVASFNGLPPLRVADL